MAPIFDTIIDHIPAPIDNSDEPLQFQVSLLDYNDFVGRIGIGRVFRGTVKVGDQVTLSKLDGTTKNFRVTKLFGFFGLERREIQEAKAGDLIAVSGMEDIFVGETITPKMCIRDRSIWVRKMLNAKPSMSSEWNFWEPRWKL